MIHIEDLLKVSLAEKAFGTVYAIYSKYCTLNVPLACF
jgi:hypothetical protein